VPNTAAARRYAGALFSLASDEDGVQSIRDQLVDMDRLFDDNPELQRRLFQPLHPVAERRSVLIGVCERGGLSRTVQNFFSYLIDQRRLVDFSGIRAEYERLADEAAGRVRAELRSASPLDEQQRERVTAALARRTGKQIDLAVHVDPTLLGGAIATVGGLVFDGSLKSQLALLRATLMKGSMQGTS
jgi:F-type H+-transporting ATPase subunit delta